MYVYGPSLARTYIGRHQRARAAAAHTSCAVLLSDTPVAVARLGLRLPLIHFSKSSY